MAIRLVPQLNADTAEALPPSGPANRRMPFEVQAQTMEDLGVDTDDDALLVLNCIAAALTICKSSELTGVLIAAHVHGLLSQDGWSEAKRKKVLPCIRQAIDLQLSHWKHLSTDFVRCALVEVIYPRAGGSDVKLASNFLADGLEHPSVVRGITAMREKSRRERP